MSVALTLHPDGEVRTPAVRIRPVPRSEPLADDERHAGRARPRASEGVLPPDLATGVRVRRSRRGSRAAEAGNPGATVPAQSGAAPGRASVVQTPESIAAVLTAPLHAPPPPLTTLEPAAGVVTVVAPGLGPATDLDTPPPPSARELRVAARRLLGTCIEIIGGFRPIAQLRPHCAPERFDAIANRLLRPTGTGRGHGATRAPVVASTARAAKPGRPTLPDREDRVTIRRVQICDVIEGVAELAVVMSRRGKIWAMAMRMEHTRGRWRCMHMEVL